MSLEQSLSAEEQYVDRLYSPDAVLEKIKQQTAAHGMPDIAVSDGYGRLITMLVSMNKTKQALEIGALGGYSGVCIARGLQPDGHLTSLELLPAYAEVAKQNVTEAGFGEAISYIVGDAKQSLAQLVEENKRFDFFFIDADKEGYQTYLEFAIKLANKNALIIVDNILLRGRILNEQKQGPAVRAVREFNINFASDTRLESTILPGYDGLAIARVK